MHKIDVVEQQPLPAANFKTLSWQTAKMVTTDKGKYIYCAAAMPEDAKAFWRLYDKYADAMRADGLLYNKSKYDDEKWRIVFKYKVKPTSLDIDDETGVANWQVEMRAVCRKYSDIDLTPKPRPKAKPKPKVKPKQPKKVTKTKAKK